MWRVTVAESSRSSGSNSERSRRSSRGNRKTCIISKEFVKLEAAAITIAAAAATAAAATAAAPTAAAATAAAVMHVVVVINDNNKNNNNTFMIIIFSVITVVITRISPRLGLSFVEVWQHSAVDEYRRDIRRNMHDMDSSLKSYRLIVSDHAFVKAIPLIANI